MGLHTVCVAPHLCRCRHPLADMNGAALLHCDNIVREPRCCTEPVLQTVCERLDACQIATWQHRPSRLHSRQHRNAGFKHVMTCILLALPRSAAM